jgi:hypothetical protein
MSTVSRKMLNFHRIKNLVGRHADEEEILPLLDPPALSDGLFELFLHEETDTMCIKHWKEGSKPVYSTLNNPTTPISLSEGNLKFIGVYASEKDIMADWPEYLL